jgi:hypothetical protein
MRRNTATRAAGTQCALTDVLHAQFELALARFKAGELDYANEVEDVLRKVPEQRRQISELEDR